MTQRQYTTAEYQAQLAEKMAIFKEVMQIFVMNGPIIVIGHMNIYLAI